MRSVQVQRHDMLPTEGFSLRSKTECVACSYFEHIRLLLTRGFGTCSAFFCVHVLGQNSAAANN